MIISSLLLPMYAFSIGDLEVEIDYRDFSEGDHTLVITVVDDSGRSGNFTYQFTVPPPPGRYYIAFKL